MRGDNLLKGPILKEESQKKHSFRVLILAQKSSNFRE